MTTRELLFLRWVLRSRAIKPGYRESDDVRQAEAILRAELERRCKISDAQPTKAVSA